MYYGDEMEYHDRIIDEVIEERLKKQGIVNIVGPRECGKSATARNFAKSRISFEDKFESYKQLYDFYPHLIIKGDKPMLIDDIEEMPQLKNLIVNESRKTNGNGLFITTNSKSSRSSLLMLPMSLYESGESSGDISILSLFDNPNMDIDGVESFLAIEDLISVACRGGWPKSLKKEDEVKNYVRRIVKKYLTSDKQRNYLKSEAILRVYAENIFSDKKTVDLLDDVHKICPKLAKSTFYNYINALKELYVIMEIPSWGVDVKSKYSTKTQPKRAFCDPSIAVAALNTTQNRLLFNLELFKVIFKNLCIRDLMVYTTPRNGKIFHYADRYGGEVDCVLEIDNGDYALINFTLSNYHLDESVDKLLKINKIISKKVDDGILAIKKPRFLAVITASKFAYTQRDGVKVIPIGVLR